MLGWLLIKLGHFFVKRIHLRVIDLSTTESVPLLQWAGWFIELLLFLLRGGTLIVHSLNLGLNLCNFTLKFDILEHLVAETHSKLGIHLQSCRSGLLVSLAFLDHRSRLDESCLLGWGLISLLLVKTPWHFRWVLASSLFEVMLDIQTHAIVNHLDFGRRRLDFLFEEPFGILFLFCDRL